MLLQQPVAISDHTSEAHCQALRGIPQHLQEAEEFIHACPMIGLEVEATATQRPHQLAVQEASKSKAMVSAHLQHGRCVGQAGPL